MSLKNKTDLGSSIYKLEISVSAADFENAVTKAYAKSKAKIAVPGFRKGKAPRNIIEKIYGEGVFYEDALDLIYADTINSAVKESELDVVARPYDNEVVSIGKSGVELSVKVAVKPPVEIEGYKDHGIKKETKEVDDAAIEARLKELAEKNVRFVEADRAAQNGDTTVIDFEGFVDGTAFAGGKGEGYSLTLGSNQFIPGFEEQIAGHGNGEEFDVNVSFPEDYHAPELAGKPAVFKVKLNEIKTKEYPEIDDEFAKDASEFDTLAELKADIAEKLKKEYEDAAENKFENEIIDKLCETAKIDIPNAMLEDRIDENYRNFEYSIRAKGISVEDYFKYTGMSADAMRVTLKPQSERQIKLRLILETIAKLENLTATEEEIASEYEKLAGQYAMDADKLKSLVPKSEIAADVATQKAMDFVKNAG